MMVLSRLPEFAGDPDVDSISDQFATRRNG
jgi:hypothetical protein